jgi:hypothetical protein
MRQAWSVDVVAGVTTMVRPDGIDVEKPVLLQSTIIAMCDVLSSLRCPLHQPFAATTASLPLLT